MDLLKGIDRGRQDAVHQAFHGTLDGGKRGAEFVADIPDQLPAHGFHLFKFFRHLVKGVSQLPKLIGPGSLNPLPVMTVSNAPAGGR